MTTLCNGNHMGRLAGRICLRACEGRSQYAIVAAYSSLHLCAVGVTVCEAVCLFSGARCQLVEMEAEIGRINVAVSEDQSKAEDGAGEDVEDAIEDCL